MKLHWLRIAVVLLALMFSASVPAAETTTANSGKLASGEFTFGEERGYLFLPDGFEPGGTEKFLLFFHGHGAKPGTPGNLSAADFKDFLRLCSERGYVVAVPGYGNSWLSPDGEKLTLEMLDFLAEKLQMNLDRLYVMGCSMGGGATLIFSARHPDRVIAACDIFGVTDMVDFSKGKYAGSIHTAFGGTAEERLEIYRERSAVNQVEVLKDVPLLIIHGNADKIVDKSYSDRLVEKLRAAGGERFRYIVVPGVDHENRIIRGFENTVLDFFETAAAGQMNAQ